MNERPAELARSEPYPLDIAPVSRKRRRTPGRRCGHCPATAYVFGLRPVPESFWSSEQLLDPFGSKGGQLPVDLGLPSRATARRLIDHIDSIALTDEEMRPAKSPIGRTHPVRRG